MSPKLEATPETMDSLWSAIHKTKGQTCKVPVEDLSRLLIDHQTLLKVLKGEFTD